MAMQTKELMEDTGVYLHDCQITEIFTTERGIAFWLRNVKMKDPNGLYEGEAVVFAEETGPEEISCVKEKTRCRALRHIRNFFNTSFATAVLRLWVKNPSNGKSFELWVDIPCQKVHYIRGSEWKG